MPSVTVLINSFIVPEGRETEFLAAWNKTAALMQQAPGFIDTTLHRTLDSEARFQFVNVAHWESPDAFYAAITAHEPKEKQFEWLEANPALYAIEQRLQIHADNK
jgi:heme oxygenase (mycobilin-producing)